MKAAVLLALVHAVLSERNWTYAGGYTDLVEEIKCRAAATFQVSLTGERVGRLVNSAEYQRRRKETMV
jgi:hypothetical protein